MLKLMRGVLVMLLGCLQPGWAADVADAVRVLMIGNSYTFYHKLPDALMALSRKTDCPLVVDSYTVGAMSLRGFLDSEQHARARRLLEEGDYDWVVLQDQSQTPAYRPDETLLSVRRWAELARAKNTNVLLFLTWAHATKESGQMRPMVDMQEKTSLTYCRAAVACGARVAPVGEAWARWYELRPEMPLHARDGSHPNAEGSYLAACVLHAALSGKPLKGIPGTLKLGRKEVLRVPGDVAKELQKTANAALKSFESPQEWLRQQAEMDAGRPGLEAVRPMLQKGVKAAQVAELVGKPFYVSRSRGQVVQQFRLRDGVELCLYCTQRGVVQQASITAPGRTVEIIDVSAL